jgi:hypothetical protein
VFPCDEIARDAGISLDAPRVFRRAGEHLAEDARARRTARELIRRLPAVSECIHLLWSGAFRHADTIPVVLDLAGARCETLSIATLGFDARAVQILLTELDGGRINRIEMVSCVYAQAHFRELDSWLTSELKRRGSRHAAVRTHAKVLAFSFAEGQQIAIESSSNLRSCRMLELSVVTHDPALVAFHAGWIRELLDEARA